MKSFISEDDIEQAICNRLSQPGIRMSELKAYRFCLPPMDVIDKFTNSVSGLLASIDKIRKSNTLLSRQRDLLLPRLMSGKLEVKAMGL